MHYSNFRLFSISLFFCYLLWCGNVRVKYAIYSFVSLQCCFFWSFFVCLHRNAPDVRTTFTPDEPKNRIELTKKNLNIIVKTMNGMELTVVCESNFFFTLFGLSHFKDLHLLLELNISFFKRIAEIRAGSFSYKYTRAIIR